MNSGVLPALAVIVAGFAAGAINAVAAGGTLLAFPVLIAVGVPPWSANIACTLGLLPGYAGGAWGYRDRFRGIKQVRNRLTVLALMGGVAGALALLRTPKESFAAVVPFLILLAVALFIARPWIDQRLAARSSKAGIVASLPITVIGVLCAAAYGSYFGAAVGVVFLAVLGAGLSTTLAVDNALKSVLSLAAVISGAVVFVAAQRVEWPPVLLLIASSALGGFWGARVSRRIPDGAIRWLVIAVGLIAAAVLLVTR